MALPEVFWTSLFILIAIGILVFFGLMVRKSLQGDGGCSCAGDPRSGERSTALTCDKKGSSMKKKDSSCSAEKHGCENCSGCTVENPYKKV